MTAVAIDLPAGEVVSELESAAAKFAEEFDYGAEVGREWFEKEWGIVYPEQSDKKTIREIDGRFNMMLGKFKKFLIVNHQKVLNTEAKPWHVLKPEDMAGHARETAAERIKQAIGYGNTVVENTPVDKLTDAGRKERTDTANRLALIDLFSKRVLSQGKRLTDGGERRRLKVADAWSVMQLCKEKSVKLKLRDGDLTYEAAPGAYTEELRGLVDEFKEELTELLRRGVR